MGAASNARWIALSQVGRVLAQLIGIAVLARLLTPADYGVMAMASVVTSLAGMLRDMGTGSAIVQKSYLEDRTTTAVFWLNLAMGTLVGLFTAGCASFIAGGFQSSDLTSVLWAMSVAFPISAAAIAHQALLERQSSFAVLARIELVSALVGLIAAIGAALAGAGVYSLVLQTVLGALLSTIQLWVASRWRPSLRAGWRDLSSVMHFSGHLAGFNLVNFVSRNADSMIIGRFMGAAALGNYSVAYKLMLFPLQNLTFVVSRALFPVMSRHQSDLPRLLGLYLRSVRILAMLTAPLMAGAFVLREPLVLHMFGSKWTQAAEVLAWLAPTGFVQSIVSTTGTVFMARGRTDLLLRLGIVGMSLTVGGLVLGMSGGVVGVAMFYFVANLLNAAPCLYLVMKQLDSEVSQLLRIIAPIFGATVVMVVALYGLRHFPWFSPPTSIQGFVFNCGLGAFAYVASLRFVFGQDFRDIKQLLRPS